MLAPQVVAFLKDPQYANFTRVVFDTAPTGGLNPPPPLHHKRNPHHVTLLVRG